MSEHKLRQLRSDFAVGIGMPCLGAIPWQTAMALARTTHFAATIGVPINLHVVANSSLVQVARDVILANFLAGTENYLFWIDSDIVWAPEDFFQVLRLAKDLGIVCGAYPLKREPPECVINFTSIPNDATVPYNGCVKVDGMGLGFTCVRRDLVEAFAATKQQMYHAGNGRMILDAFRVDKATHADGSVHARGEDGAFFADMKVLGHQAWLDPTISLGHVGTKEYRVPLEAVSEIEATLQAVKAA